MTDEPSASPGHDAATGPDAVEMPRPTVAPLVLALGLVLLAAGVVLGQAFVAVGGLIFVVGLGTWVGQLLPGRGHVHEPLVEPARQARPVAGVPGGVEQLQAGMPGYRMRLPERVHPISAGIKGGVVGGLVMIVPAVAYGYFSGHGFWYPVNLLAGMVITDEDLNGFHPSLLVAGTVIHATVSVVIGLLYGVLLPTLPRIPRPLAWGGLLMPMLWTAVCFGLMRGINPVLYERVDWPWFIASQFIFGVVTALVVLRAAAPRPAVTGLLGGMVGGLLMPLPAVLWSLATRNGPWYPINLLAGTVVPGMDELSAAELRQFHANWLAVAVVLHGLLSLGFGLAYGLLLPRLPPIPSPVAWGGMLMPLLWTAVSFGLMGVINPVLQQKVSWPWFILSQFVFGVAAALVVIRSQQIPIPPRGAGPEPVEEYVAGTGEGQP